MKLVSRLFSIGITLILTIHLFGLDTTASIIGKKSFEFQTINLKSFAEWPGVGTDILIDSSLLGGRLTLIWPGSLISLDSQAKADAKTILALFASTHSNSEWNPENGTLSTDGDWVTLDSKRGYSRLNLHSAEIQFYPDLKSLAAPIRPLADGAVLAIGTKSSSLIRKNGSIEILDIDFPLSNLLAISAFEDRMAWFSSENAELRIASYLSSTDLLSSSREADFERPLPKAQRFSMVWAGSILVIGLSGEVVLADTESAQFQRRAHTLIPRYWYQLRGGKNGFSIISPETAKLIYYNADSDPGDLDASYDFASILKEFAPEAGELLSAEGDEGILEEFYRWVLGLIRGYRSLYPLDFDWADLEEEFLHRRNQNSQV